MSEVTYSYDFLQQEALTATDTTFEIDGIEYIACRDFGEADINPISNIPPISFLTISQFAGGMTYGDIAAQHGKTEDTIRRRMHEAGTEIGLPRCTVPELTSFLPMRKDYFVQLDFSNLTLKQRTVLHLIGLGVPVKNIAFTLQNTSSNIRNHRLQIAEQLGLAGFDQKAVAIRRIAGAMVNFETNISALPALGQAGSGHCYRSRRKRTTATSP